MNHKSRKAYSVAGHTFEHRIAPCRCLSGNKQTERQTETQTDRHKHTWQTTITLLAHVH